MARYTQHGHQVKFVAPRFGVRFVRPDGAKPQQSLCYFEGFVREDRWEDRSPKVGALGESSLKMGCENDSL